jgi:hypothetical protein
VALRRYVVLATDLFPDRAPLERAIESLKPDARVDVFDLVSERMEAERWDAVVQAILAADEVITL